MKDGSDTNVMGVRSAREPDEGGALPTADALRGAIVHDRQGTEIGTVNDVVTGDDGRVASVVIEVGGYVGIGSHAVSIAAHRLSVRDEGEGTRIVLGMTREELRGLPEHGEPVTPPIVPPHPR